IGHSFRYNNKSGGLSELCTPPRLDRLIGEKTFLQLPSHPDFVVSPDSRRSLVQSELVLLHCPAKESDLLLKPENQTSQTTRILGRPIQTKWTPSLWLGAISEFALLAPNHDVDDHKVKTVGLDEVVHDFPLVLHTLSRGQLVHPTSGRVEFLPTARTFGPSLETQLERFNLRHPVFVRTPKFQDFLTFRGNNSDR